MATSYYKRDSKGKIVVVPQGIPSSSSSSSKSSSSSSSQPTGGMSTPSGGSVLVTPGGTVVGSAAPPTKTTTKKSSGGGGGGGSSSSSQPVVQTVAQPTGGMSTPSGQSVIVTPQGQVVGSAGPISKQSSSSIQTSRSGSTIQSQVMSVAPQQSTSSIQDSRINPATGKPYAFVSEVKTDRSFSNVYGLQEDITRKRTALITKEERGQGNILTGVGAFGLGFLGAGVSTTRAVFNPIETAKGAVSTTGKIIKDPLGSASSAKESIGSSVRTDPFGFAGGVTGDIVIGAGIAKGVGKGITKGTDLYRTKGLKEIPMEDVVAPEYLAGQKYPQIKKGETAEELMSEFKKPLSGFTASGNPLKGNELGRGSSELPGLYQAPKLSPTFLKVTPGDSPKVFSIKLSETLRPTIFKVKPTDYELVPGVKPKQSTLYSKGKAKQFFETEAERGKAYVPFIKTEKEAVIPFGTKVDFQKDIGYIKFEGRRIPIKEYKTKVGGKTGGNDILPDQKIKTAYDIEKRSSSSRVGKTSRYDTIDVVRFIPSSSSDTSSSNSNYIISGRSSTSFRTKTSSSSPIIKSKVTYTSPQKDYYRQTPRSSTSSYVLNGGSYKPSSTPRGGFKFAALTPPGGLPQFGMGSKSKSQIRKGVSGYTPSLTGSVRYNVLGETAGKGTIKLQAGLPSVRPVISSKQTLRVRRSR